VTHLFLSFHVMMKTLPGAQPFPCREPFTAMPGPPPVPRSLVLNHADVDPAVMALIIYLIDISSHRSDGEANYSNYGRSGPREDRRYQSHPRQPNGHHEILKDEVLRFVFTVVPVAVSYQISRSTPCGIHLVTRRHGTLAAPFNSSVRCSRATAYDGVVGSHLGRRFSTPGGTCLRCFGARLIWALPIRLDQLSGPGTYVILFELVPEPVNGQYRGRPLQAAFTDICG